jgi:hypothetical protein
LLAVKPEEADPVTPPLSVTAVGPEPTVTLVAALEGMLATTPKVGGLALLGCVSAFGAEPGCVCTRPRFVFESEFVA